VRQFVINKNCAEMHGQRNIGSLSPEMSVKIYTLRNGTPQNTAVSMAITVDTACTF